MIGYIMKNRQIAIGMDTTGAPLTVDRHAVQRLGHPGCDLAQCDARTNAQSNPDGQIAFEESHGGILPFFLPVS